MAAALPGNDFASNRCRICELHQGEIEKRHRHNPDAGVDVGYHVHFVFRYFYQVDSPQNLVAFILTIRPKSKPGKAALFTVPPAGTLILCAATR